MRAVEFEFGGRLSLDLTWTMRYRAVRPTELFRSPDDVREWLSAADLPVPATVSPQDLADVVELRESIMRAASALVEEQPIPAADRAVINRWAAQPSASPALTADGSREMVVVQGRVLAAALSSIARDAVDLLSLRDGRLRRCEGPQCSLLFHDTSRPGTRRWCNATRCGNKVNTKAYRRRASDSGAGGDA